MPTTVPLVSVGMRVAWLCLRCDAQLESEWVEHVHTPPALRHFAHLHNRAIRWYEAKRTSMDRVNSMD